MTTDLEIRGRWRSAASFSAISSPKLPDSRDIVINVKPHTSLPQGFQYIHITIIYMVNKTVKRLKKGGNRS
jgi:hypothetical protein